MEILLILGSRNQTHFYTKCQATKRHYSTTPFRLVEIDYIHTRIRSRTPYLAILRNFGERTASPIAKLGRRSHGMANTAVANCMLKKVLRSR